MEVVDDVYLFEDIDDMCSVIDVKLNFDIPEGETWQEQMQDIPFTAIRKYVADLGCEILYASAGVHLLGERKQPHVHYNFITSQVYPPSNLSQHRKRWAKKTDAAPEFLNCSFKFHATIDKTKPKYSPLSYPLKEGHIIQIFKKDIYINLTNKQIQYLADIGTSIYQKEQGLKLRQDKCEERKKNSLLALYDVVKDRKFLDFKSMLLYLDKEYIEKLDFTDYPDPKNYKSNCQKIAVKIGILKYSDL